MATDTPHRREPAQPGDASLRMRLDPGEPLDSGLRRVALEQLEVAAQGFSAPDGAAALADGIHRARKATKRTRALLRLVRDDLGNEVYRNENSVLRDQAKRLSDLRIANVLGETLDLLVAESVLLPADAVDVLRREILAHCDALTADFRADIDGRAAAKTAIACTRARITSWPGFSDPPESVGPGAAPTTTDLVTVLPGFVRVYAKGRRALKKARTSRTTFAFHEWRKQANYLRYQIEALRGRLPFEIEEWGQPLGDLSETLGVDHDLADLGRLIEGDRVPFGGATDATLLLGAIERLRTGKERTALQSRKLIYREPPARLEERLAAAWEQSN